MGEHRHNNRCIGGGVHGLHGGSIVWLLKPDGLYIALLLSGICPLVLAGFISHAYMKMGEEISQREEKLKQVNQELEAALQDVQELSGLLPICSFCKKIRDDKGYWNQVEEYIQNHTKAQFTHGLCPECYERETRRLDEMMAEEGTGGRKHPA